MTPRARSFARVAGELRQVELMDQDTRIGLAMGILLVGVVGALFFRNESASDLPPEMADTEAINERIAERPIGPYLARGEKKKPEPQKIASSVVPVVTRSGRVPDPIPQEIQAVASTPAPVVPQLPEIPVVATPAPAAPETQYSEYRVQSGDTLSDIAERYLGTSSRYMEIYELNRDRLATPHDLRVGRRILLPRSRN